MNLDDIIYTYFMVILYTYFIFNENKKKVSWKYIIHGKTRPFSLIKQTHRIFNLGLGLSCLTPL